MKMTKILLCSIVLLALLHGVVSGPQSRRRGRGRGRHSSEEWGSSEEEDEYIGCFRPKVCRILNVTSQEDTALCNETAECSDRDSSTCRSFGQPGIKATLNGTLEYSYCLPQECSGPDDRDTCRDNRNCTQVTFNNETRFLCLNSSDFSKWDVCLGESSYWRFFTFLYRYARGFNGRRNDPTCCDALCYIKILAARRERARRRGSGGSRGRRGRFGRWGRWGRRSRWGRWSSWGRRGSSSYWGYTPDYDYDDDDRKGCANITVPATNSNNPILPAPTVIPIIP